MVAYTCGTSEEYSKYGDRTKVRAILTTSQSQSLIDAIKRRAAAKGQTVSQYVGEVLAASLTATERRKIRQQKRYKREASK